MSVSNVAFSIKVLRILSTIAAALLIIGATGCASDNAISKMDKKHPRSNCGNPSNTIQPAEYLGDYPILGSCVGTNVATPNHEVIFFVTGWSSSTDDNGRNIHSYNFNKMDACNPCYGSSTGRVDDCYIIDCEESGQCGEGTPLAQDKTKITLQKTH
jgi:hypothetical protein